VVGSPRRDQSRECVVGRSVRLPARGELVNLADAVGPVVCGNPSQAGVGCRIITYPSSATVGNNAETSSGHTVAVDRQEEFVLRTLEERDIRFVRLWFTDVLGYLKSVSVAPAELEGAFAEGIGFDGSAVEGFARVYEADVPADAGGERDRRDRPDVLRHPAA
jgi:hypothetical protein